MLAAWQTHLGGGSFSSDTQPCEAGLQMDCVKLKNKKKAAHVAAYVYKTYIGLTTTGDPSGCKRLD